MTLCVQGLLEDERFFGKLHLYEGIKQHFRRIFEANRPITVITGGVGYGKTMLSNMLLATRLYEVIRDDKEEASFIVHGPDPALEYQCVQSFLSDIEDLDGMLEYKDDECRIDFIGGEIVFCNSELTGTVHMAIVREGATTPEGACAYGKNGETPYRIILESSARYPGNMTNQLALHPIGSLCYTISESLWSLHPEKFSGERFLIVYDPITGIGRIAEANPDMRYGIDKILYVPMEFIEDFQKDFRAALMDIAGICPMVKP